MEPRTVLSRLLEQSRRLGARAAEVLFEQGAGQHLAWAPGGEISTTPRSFLRARLVVYLAEGRHAAVALEAESPDALLDRVEPRITGALDEAERAAPSPLAAPPERLDIEARGLGLADRRLALLDREDRHGVLLENVRGCAEAHPEIAVLVASYGELALARAFASTRGVSATEATTRFEADIEARLGRDGRRYRQRVASRQFASVASIPFGLELGERFKRLARPTDLPAAPLPVIVESHATAQLLRSLARAFATPDVRAGRSFVASLPDRRIGSPRVHVIDDPALPGALLTRSFDDRGVAPSPVVILREGSTGGFYLDPEDARAADLRPTGHVLDGRLQPSNLILRPGGRSRNAIGMDLGDYLCLEVFHTDPLVDVATGALSTTCDLLLYRNHHFRGAIPGVRLDTHVTGLLRDVREVASDQLRLEEVDACPLILAPRVFTP